MKHAVGDKVKIKSKEWIDSQLKDEDGDIYLFDAIFMNRDMFQYAGTEATITSIEDDDSYYFDITGSDWYWSDEMLEEVI